MVRALPQVNERLYIRIKLRTDLFIKKCFVFLDNNNGIFSTFFNFMKSKLRFIKLKHNDEESVNGIDIVGFGQIPTITL